MSLTTDAPVPAPARGLNALGDLSEHLLSVLERGGADMSKLGVPAQPEPEDGLWEDVNVPQARARRNIWIGSIREASHDRYLQLRLTDLDANQKPKTLQNWLSSLVEAKRVGAEPECLQMIVPGNIGSGKTTAVVALGTEASEKGLLVRFVKHATYLNWLRPDSAPSGKSSYSVRKDHVEADLLVLDELCGDMTGLATDFVCSKTTDLVESRLAAGRATIYTTNLKSRRRPGSQEISIVDILGERLVSRLGDRAASARIEGPDRRKPARPLDW
ncbi:ATP-binding protein [Streptomyces sp. SP18BB07]|uniref:ATP-binding protein n=1 Tax=Streptomyces sp. SP18BB07 TaxID=3002522 RepID=UPI002E77E7FE|nr:ATP-binding protein [Streptomyces sp. SP18BB07]MEE1764434.1 ATP-binding protein [Streptomyces sp. SP18BB07]